VAALNLLYFDEFKFSSGFRFSTQNIGQLENILLIGSPSSHKKSLTAKPGSSKAREQIE
jgi:hypothetical protein